MNYYQHHIGDYARDTAHLTPLEDGTYRRMLDIYYASEKPLPLNIDGLYRLVRARTRPEREAVDAILEEYFKREPDGWHNKRADEEIARAHAKSEKAKGSAALRWQQERNANASEDAMRSHSEGNAPISHKPLANSQEPEAKGKSVAAAARRPAGKVVPLTADVWTAYAAAYQHRYGVAPVRNKRVNAMLAQFVERVGAAEAPDIASFYVGHGRGLYISARHDVTLLLRDAEALRMEWATGRKVTDAEARQADRTASTGAQVERLLSEAR